MHTSLYTSKSWRYVCNTCIAEVPDGLGTDPLFIVIDDDPTATLVTQINIKKFNRNATVVRFSDPSLALEFLGSLPPSNSDKNARILFLDLHMPGTSGYDFLRSMDLLQTANQHLYIYVLSSTIDSREIEKILEYKQVSGFIAKPLTIEGLEDIFAAQVH